MKTLVMLGLVYMIFSEAFQASAALKCYQCAGSTCGATTVTCTSPADTCQSTSVEVQGKKAVEKGCVTKAACDVAKQAGFTTCCQTDLCNGAEGVKLSLLFMLVPLISSILFL